MNFVNKNRKVVKRHFEEATRQKIIISRRGKMELKNREKLSNSEPILPSDTLSSPSTSSTFALTNTHKVLLVVGAAFITLLLVLMTVDIKGEESESTIVESKIIYHFQLAKIFTSNMVLPRAPFRAKLWGWCDAPTCAVNITFNNRTYLADVDSYPDSNDLFRWETKLPRTEGPFSLYNYYFYINFNKIMDDRNN